MGRPFLYKCPRTGINVQGWLEAETDVSTSNEYVPHTCLACGGIHLVNPTTGKLLLEAQPPRPERL
jgi:hypothetical protein